MTSLATAPPPYPMRTAQEKRTAYLARLSQLRSDRSSWISHWSELGRHILPRAPRFFATDRNRAGDHKYGSILDNTATRSLRVLSAGMMAGMTSPARPWFRLAVPDPDLVDSHGVRIWLDDVVERMQRVFARSNVYRALQQLYEDLGAFGTNATLVLSDPQSVIRCYSLPIGEYSLQQDYQGRVTTCYREFERTVVEVVKEFGWHNCSEAVQQAFRNRAFESTVNILHVIEPRADQERRPDSRAAIDMPWASVYIEISGEADDKLLRESGFQTMRVLAPRWGTSGADVYGISPGMEALGDIKQLQQEQLRKSQAIDYQTKPPLQVPQSVRDRSQDILPGGIQYYEPGSTIPFDQVTANGGVRTAWEVNLDIGALLADIEDVRMRVKRTFHEDMFLMLTMADNRMTATEVLERQEEKLLMIGPVIERLANEALEPLVSITFQDMLEQGLLPPPPPELAGTELTVEFVSILAQAQRAVGITSVQQYVNDVLAVGATRPDVLDNVNFDNWARSTAHMRGVAEDMLVDKPNVQELREARAQAEAAREQTEIAAQQASTVKDLSTAPVDQNTALNEVMNSLAGTPAEP